MTSPCVARPRSSVSFSCLVLRSREWGRSSKANMFHHTDYCVFLFCFSGKKTNRATQIKDNTHGTTISVYSWSAMCVQQAPTNIKICSSSPRCSEQCPRQQQCMCTYVGSSSKSLQRQTKKTCCQGTCNHFKHPDQVHICCRVHLRIRPRCESIERTYACVSVHQASKKTVGQTPP